MLTSLFFSRVSSRIILKKWGVPDENDVWLVSPSGPLDIVGLQRNELQGFVLKLKESLPDD